MKNTGYPLDLNAALNYTRFAAYGEMHPYPSMIGSVSGILPLMDVLKISPVSDYAWGNNVNSISNPQFMPGYQQILQPNLQKVRG